MPEEDEMLLILFSHLFVNNNDDNIRFHDLNFLYDDKHIWNCIKSTLNNDSHVLQSERFIEYNNDGGFVDRETIRIMRWHS